MLRVNLAPTLRIQQEACTPLQSVSWSLTCSDIAGPWEKEPLKSQLRKMLGEQDTVNSTASG